MQNEEKDSLGRRTFLKRLLGGLGLLALGGGSWLVYNKVNASPKEIPVRMMGASHTRGHKLRGPIQFAPKEERTVEVLIVGAGIAGLSAARALNKAGIKNIAILELEDYAGGNSSFGQNTISKYPWGAHYVPIPDPENKPLLALFEELGVIKGYVNGQPWYEESYLCQAPHERLFIHGSWQEGLVPKLGVPDDELRQIEAFHAEMEKWKQRIGNDGKPMFAIPVANASQDPYAHTLDTMHMMGWMHIQGWTSPHLHWYVNYCCRDDFGAPHDKVSAWAGIHYFAARGGTAANASGSDVLTWPEGNGWLMQQMKAPFEKQVQVGHMVTQIRNVEGGIEADVIRCADNHHIRFKAKAAVFAAPRFVAQRVVADPSPMPNISYAPWVVANVTLLNRPEGPGAPLSWDNVAYESSSLGYILADHQSLSGVNPHETVITWYEPLTDESWDKARQMAYVTTPEQWRERVLADLEKMQPGITEQVKEIEVMVWGHGMAVPKPGFLTVRNVDPSLPTGRIFYAHSDITAISIFEEAFYWGNVAAEAVLKTLA